jgi:uncharacterized delta-60 repeat protein
VVITFTPTAAGMTAQNLIVNYASGSTSTSKMVFIPVQGTGAAPTPANLTFSSSSPLTFADAKMDETQSTTVMLTNSGQIAASSVSAQSLSAPFSYKGGSFPGVGGTCGNSLAAGASCLVALSFTPTLGGTFSTPWTINYSSSGTAKTSTLQLQGVGIPGGTRDLTFNSTGLLSLSLTGQDSVKSLDIQSSGNIVLIGSEISAGESNFSLIRLLDSGSLDTSFGTSGRVSTDLGTGTVDVAYGATVDSNGKILVSGSSDAELALVRYNADGTIDTSFNGGTLNTLFNTLNLGSDTIGFQPVVAASGKVVVIGQTVPNSSVQQGFAVQLTSTGMIDALSFGGLGLGRQNYNIGSSTSSLKTLKYSSSGKYIAAGYEYSGTNQQAVVLRANTNGALDSTYATSGLFTNDFSGNGKPSEVLAMAMPATDKPIFVGSVSNGSNKDVLIFRLTSTGTLDTSFGTNGVIKLDIAGTDDQAAAVAIDSSSRIVVVANYMDGSDQAIALLRFSADGIRDTKFGSNGLVMDHVAGLNLWASAVSFDLNNKIVVAGQRNYSGGSDYLVLRYLP